MTEKQEKQSGAGEAPKRPGGLKETEKRTIHRYHLICKLLGFSALEFDGVSPDESEAMIKSAIDVLKNQRTDQQVFFNIGDKVKLLDKTYEIKPLSIDKDLAWREKCGEIATEIVDELIDFAGPPAGIQVLPDVPIGDEDVPLETIERAQKQYDEIKAKNQILLAARNKEMFKKLVPYIMGAGLDKIVDLLFLYSPELRKDETAIRKGAPSHEVVGAAMTAINIAFPFVLSIVRGTLAVVDKAKQSGAFQGMTF